MHIKHTIQITGATLLSTSLLGSPALANTLVEALTSGQAYGNLRLRYEAAEQDNSLKDADALTLRTRLGYKTGEAAGFDIIIVETVGVGQSETRVADMTDMFLLLLLPGAGDELQGIKRGIVELADLILINKADDDLGDLARRAAAEYRSALQLLHPRSPNWKVEVKCCSARDAIGIDDAWETVLRHHDMLKSTGELEVRRAAQARDWLWSDLTDNLMDALRSDPQVREQLSSLEAATSAGQMPPTVAARKLLEIFLDRHKQTG